MQQLSILCSEKRKKNVLSTQRRGAQKFRNIRERRRRRGKSRAMHDDDEKEVEKEEKVTLFCNNRNKLAAAAATLTSDVSCLFPTVD